MDDFDKPSVAAIYFADATVDEALGLLDQAMKARRFGRYDEALPTGYHAGQREWIGVLTRAVPEAAAGAVLIPSDPGLVFDLAVWLSDAAPRRFFLAWRRYKGVPAVVKYFLRGQPQWKDGEDRDLEVHFNVPKKPSADLVVPEDVDLPPDLATTTRVLDPLTRPFPKNRARFPGERIVGYLHRTSPLA